MFILRKLQISGERTSKGKNGRSSGGSITVPLAKWINGLISGAALILTLPLRMVMLMFGTNGTKSVQSFHSYLTIKELYFLFSISYDT